jgi:hypothetical protein
MPDFDWFLNSLDITNKGKAQRMPWRYIIVFEDLMSLIPTHSTAIIPTHINTKPQKAGQ